MIAESSYIVFHIFNPKGIALTAFISYTVFRRKELKFLLHNGCGRNNGRLLIGPCSQVRLDEK